MALRIQCTWLLKCHKAAIQSLTRYDIHYKTVALLFKLSSDHIGQCHAHSFENCNLFKTVIAAASSGTSQGGHSFPPTTVPWASLIARSWRHRAELFSCRLSTLASDYWVETSEEQSTTQRNLSLLVNSLYFSYVIISATVLWASQWNRLAGEWVPIWFRQALWFCPDFSSCTQLHPFFDIRFEIAVSCVF